ncbi:dispanin subfamily A member 2b-like [Hemiscyllium ocellatum]|uniref:dispanin subfamily A member 2b-like n=1 Tax=Hemiscyllium ocellatum TaxID=170820 RepID=UPI0029660F37|nr:dispanin subfamily A member 2b-like [Hemiscyllium ocellatum]
MEFRADNVPLSTRSYPYQGLKDDEQTAGTTVVNVAPNVTSVRDHFLWSIFNFAFMNFCCLGFVAMVFSVKSRDRKVVGDPEGARHYASTARALNIAATVLTVLVLIIGIVVIFVSLSMVNRVIEHEKQEHPDVFGGWN